MERRFSPSVWSDFAADHNLRDSTINGLIVHDVDDRRVPIDSVRRLQRAWRRSRLLETRGLGHNRILRAPEVVSAVVAHVTGRLAAASSA